MLAKKQRGTHQSWWGKNWKGKAIVSISIFCNSPSSHLRTLYLLSHLCHIVGWSIAFESFHSSKYLSFHDWLLIPSSSENAMPLIGSVLPSQFFVVHIGLKIVCLESTIPSPVYPDFKIVPMLVLIFWSLDIILLPFHVVDEGFIISLLRQVCSYLSQHIIWESY